MKVHNHEKLKLTFAEFGALLGTRALIESGAVKHRKEASNSWRSQEMLLADPSAHIFNMGIACYLNGSSGGCGSVACIGGTMALIMGMDRVHADAYVMRNDPRNNPSHDVGPIGHLFFPPRDGKYEEITNAQAVKAIDNFLRTGKPMWASVLRKPRTAKKVAAKRNNPYAHGTTRSKLAAVKKTKKKTAKRAA